MYFGCPQPGVQQPWANNISTLIDIARIFEGVEDLKFVGAAKQGIVSEFMKHVVYRGKGDASRGSGT
jgi:hypothetical protein